MWCFDSFFFDVGAFWMFSCVFLPAVSTLSQGCVLQMWPAGGSSSINSASLSIDLSSGETWRFLPPVLSQLVFVQKTAWGGAFPACCDNKTSSTIFFLHINCSASQPFTDPSSQCRGPKSRGPRLWNGLKVKHVSWFWELEIIELVCFTSRIFCVQSAISWPAAPCC